MAAAIVTPAAARLRAIVLRDFRNIERADLSVPTLGVALIGLNGHGKTNVLEAIHYGHAMRSSRGAADKDLIRFGAPAFHLSLDAQHTRVDCLRVGVDRQTGKKHVTVDGVDVARQSDALGSLPSVLISPRDTLLITGAPSERRRYLDVLLATTSPRYLAALQRYRAALVRRNAVLRTAAGRADATARIAAWEPGLAESGATMWRERATWIAEHSTELAALCEAIGESALTTFRHHTSLREPVAVADEPDLTARLAELLVEHRASDLRRGATQVGPHRDDLSIVLGGRLARRFGSAGQQRTTAIALRILERNTLRERLGVTPVALLDDPFAELDRLRARGLMQLFDAMPEQQTILAVPRADDVPDRYSALQRWQVRHGVIGGD